MTFFMMFLSKIQRLHLLCPSMASDFAVVDFPDLPMVTNTSNGLPSRWFIFGLEFQDLADPHARAGHEFQYETISGIRRPKDDFIDYIFFKNFELGRLPCPEKLFLTQDYRRDFENQDRQNF